MLVAAPRKGSLDARHMTEHLEELTRLVDTAGAEVVGRIFQHIATANPATLIGEGKVEEVGAAVAEAGATLVIFDDELSPVQGANLERELKVRVMDRSEVILDIFSTRARSHEAKLQVELAQLEYLLPRLTRMWTHLSRIRGGIGLRGPGETQLETDRRIIRRRIQSLKVKLEGVERHRENLRAGRDPMLTVALVGYTNAGKSSILRSLSGQHDIVVEDRLFATLDTLTREVDLGEGHRARVTDTVGFIRKLPHHLVASFQSTLAEVQEADILLHVVDVSHSFAAEHIVVVRETLADIGAGGKPTVMVFNKIDRLANRNSIASLRGQHHPAVFISATRGINMTGLVSSITGLLEDAMATITLTLNASHYPLLSRLHDESEILEQRYEGEDIIVTIRTTRTEADRLRQELGGPAKAPRPRRRVSKS